MTPHKPLSFQEAMQAPEDEAVSELELGELVHRPDGYYWQAADGTEELGPYATMEEALAEVGGADADDDTEEGDCE